MCITSCLETLLVVQSTLGTLIVSVSFSDRALLLKEGGLSRKLVVCRSVSVRQYSMSLVW